MLVAYDMEIKNFINIYYSKVTYMGLIEKVSGSTARKVGTVLLGLALGGSYGCGDRVNPTERDIQLSRNPDSVASDILNVTRSPHAELYHGFAPDSLEDGDVARDEVLLEKEDGGKNCTLAYEITNHSEKGINLSSGTREFRVYHGPCDNPWARLKIINGEITSDGIEGDVWNYQFMHNLPDTLRNTALQDYQRVKDIAEKYLDFGLEPE